MAVNITCICVLVVPGQIVAYFYDFLLDFGTVPTVSEILV
jgi:hypothetical protein